MVQKAETLSSSQSGLGSSRTASAGVSSQIGSRGVHHPKALV